jgi:hypothetical protein
MTEKLICLIGHGHGHGHGLYILATYHVGSATREGFEIKLHKMAREAPSLRENGTEIEATIIR